MGNLRKIVKKLNQNEFQAEIDDAGDDVINKVVEIAKDINADSALFAGWVFTSRPLCK